jgi:hypothetical protein
MLMDLTPCWYLLSVVGYEFHFQPISYHSRGLVHIIQFVL